MPNDTSANDTSAIAESGTVNDLSEAQSILSPESVPLVSETTSADLPAQIDDNANDKPAGKIASKRVVRLPKLATAAKPAPVKATGKAKPTIVKPTVPTVAVKTAAREAELNDVAAAKAAASAAVAQYYTGGISMPFKAAVTLKRKADLNFSGADQPTKRNAAAIAAILAYCDVTNNGTFVRGSGRVPGSLLGYSGDDAKRLYSAGPESGTISGMLGREIHYVSGCHGGPGAENQILRLDFNACEAMLRTFNDKLANGERLFAKSLRQLTALRTKAGKALTPALAQQQTYIS